MVIRIKRDSHPIATLLLCAYVVSILTPYIADYYLMVPCLIGGCFFAVTSGMYLKELRKSKLILFLSGFIAASVIYRLLGVSTANWGNYAIRFMIFVSVWAGVCSWRYFSDTSRKIVLIVIIITLLTNLISNFQIHNEYPDIYPTMKGTEYFESKWGKSNVGLTSWVYCIAISSVGLCLTLWYNEKKRNFTQIKLLFLTALFFLSAVFVVVYGNSGMILISFMVTLLLVYVIAQRQSKARYIWMLMSILFAFLMLFTPALSNFAELVRDISGNKVAERIKAVANIFNGSITSRDEDYMTRLYYLAADLQSWFKNILTFFWGRGYHTRPANTAAEMIALNGAGNHSGIFDIIARYGLLGIVFLVGILKHARVFLLGNCSDPQKKRIFSLIWVVLIFNAILNNIFNYDVLFLVFFAMPFYTQGQSGQKLQGGTI